MSLDEVLEEVEKDHRVIRLESSSWGIGRSPLQIKDASYTFILWTVTDGLLDMFKEKSGLKIILNPRDPHPILFTTKPKNTL